VAQVTRRHAKHIPTVIEKDFVACDVRPPSSLLESMHVALALDGKFEQQVGKIGPADPAAVIVEDVDVGFWAGQTVVDDDQPHPRFGRRVDPRSYQAGGFAGESDATAPPHSGDY
jgi:hypothetical protein